MPSTIEGGTQVRLDRQLKYLVEWNVGQGNVLWLMFLTLKKKRFGLTFSITFFPGTTIMSDGLRSYYGLENAEGMDYEHRVVEHMYNFVDPYTALQSLVTL
uniref:ISXO2-like transposase domain-containing protein n=1 Tax=Ditylenchus dipsaci TaxID=166011 RepID=A0A915E173_9BILA